jgi:homoserine O-acetyltransferase/O-succinyltransferase
MMYMTIFLIALVCLGKLNAQCVQKTVSLGNFKTISGKVIRDCIIGYTTIGKLNPSKSNVVLWPTWITGKSKEMCNEIVPLYMDTAGFYIVVVDAFGNGISSSPSNHRSFPEITIRDMVNSQYELLTKHLRINHVKLLIGGSMGGFQVMEWLVSYPEFGDMAVSFLASPKLSTYDLMLWKTKAALLCMPSEDEKSKELALRMAWNVFLLNVFTPSYWLRSTKEEKVDSIMLARQTDILKRMKPDDFLCQVNAIITQDIYQSSGKTISDMKGHIKAKTLIIVSKSDHLVNPQSSVDLAKAIGATLLELDNDCGHAGGSCEQSLVKETITHFLRQ